MTLKAILINQNENNNELNEELRNFDEQEIALFSRRLRWFFQCKALRYRKCFPKSSNQQHVFKSKGRLNYKNNNFQLSNFIFSDIKGNII